MAAQDPLRTGAFALLVAAAALVTVLSVLQLPWTLEYPAYVLTRADVVDLWAVLSVLNVALAVIGIVGAWLSLWRRKLALAAFLIVLPIPTPFIIEANRCDVYPACEAIDWARLPRSAFAWRIRIREVDDAQLALGIAYGALERAKLTYHPWDPKLVGGQWRVETRTDDMDLGPYEVLVDAKTGKATIVHR